MDVTSVLTRVSSSKARRVQAISPRDWTVGFLLFWLLVLGAYAAFAIFMWCGTEHRATVSEVAGDRFRSEPGPCMMMFGGVVIALCGLVWHFWYAGGAE